MSAERVYRCATPATMARRAASLDFYAHTVSQLVYRDDPDDEPVVEIDTNGAIGPISNKQVVRISVLPNHPTSQELAERIWNELAWEDLEGEDWVDPADVDVTARGWDVQVKVFYR